MRVGVTETSTLQGSPCESLIAEVIRALCELGHVHRLEDLGARGPLDASAGPHSAFACLFGRDSVRMALDLIDDFPEVARATIHRLTALQGITTNDRSEEEPGRILHEHRRARDPLAERMCAHWDFPYYGAVDTTPLYVILIGAYCRRYGTGVLDECVRAHRRPQVTIGTGLERALEWIDQRIASDGYVCVRGSHPHGIRNQFWEDSYDSQFHADGRVLAPSLVYAPLAVQGYTYDALTIAGRLGCNRRREAHWMTLARRLRQRVLAEFWSAELQTFAPAVLLDTMPQQRLQIVASSPGHLLVSRLLDGEDASLYRDALVRRLLSPDMLSAAGVRTKSTTAARFAPGSYHNGSVWPVDTGVLADGLRRHGYSREANDLEERIVTACAHVGSPVEFLRGDTDGTVRVNTSVLDVVEEGVVRRKEQPPQGVQGWTATRLWRIFRTRGIVAAPRQCREQEDRARARPQFGRRPAA